MATLLIQRVEVAPASSHHWHLSRNYHIVSYSRLLPRVQRKPRVDTVYDYITTQQGATNQITWILCQLVQTWAKRCGVIYIRCACEVIGPGPHLLRSVAIRFLVYYPLNDPRANLIHDLHDIFLHLLV